MTECKVRSGQTVTSESDLAKFFKIINNEATDISVTIHRKQWPRAMQTGPDLVEYRLGGLITSDDQVARVEATYNEGKEQADFPVNWLASAFSLRVRRMPTRPCI
jgi:hypothetical protein